MSTQTIQTTAPCPTWCEEPAGHPFTDLGIGADRWHRHYVADVSAEHGLRAPQVLVERMDTPEDGAFPAQVTIARGVDASLSASEARSLAAALVTAADVIEGATA